MTESSAAHQQAIKQLGQARDQALKHLQLLSAEHTPHGDGRTVPVNQTPTPLTEANSAMKSLLLQIRPYRDRTDHWTTDLGTIQLDATKRTTSIGRGRRHTTVKQLQTQSQTIQLEDLGDVATIANREIVYTTPSTTPRNRGDTADRYVIVLRTAELQRVLQLADDCLDDLEMLASVTESGGASFDYSDILWTDTEQADEREGMQDG